MDCEIQHIIPDSRFFMETLHFTAWGAAVLAENGSVHDHMMGYQNVVGWAQDSKPEDLGLDLGILQFASSFLSSAKCSECEMKFCQESAQ